MNRAINKRMRDSFNCERQITQTHFGSVFMCSRLYDTEKQRLLILKRLVK